MNKDTQGNNNDNTPHNSDSDASDSESRSLPHRKKSGRIKRALFESFCVTLLALGLSTLLVSPFTASISTLFSSPEQNDFQFSDIFTQMAYNRPVRQLDDRIVIIDIANSNRREIAEQLMLLSMCNPMVAAVDVIFAQPTEDDTDLMEALSSFRNIILPLTVKLEKTASELENTELFSIRETSFLQDSLNLESITYSSVTFPTSSEIGRARVRRYSTIFPTIDGDTIESMAFSLARYLNPEATARLIKENKRHITINYPSREFTIIRFDEIADRYPEIEGKIVIMGSLNDAYDMHATPINSYIPGAIIHAHALATILDDIDYFTMPEALDYILAISICFLMIFLCMISPLGYRGLLRRTLQLLLLYAFIVLGYSLYVDRHIICDFSFTILMIAFGLFAYDLWVGINTLCLLIAKKISIHKKHS